MTTCQEAASEPDGSTATATIRAFVDYYRCPESFLRLKILVGSAQDPTTALCQLTEVLVGAAVDGSLCVTFDPTALVEHLRRERYVGDAKTAHATQLLHRAISAAYRFVRPTLSVPLRKHLQRRYLRDWRQLTFPSWPVDRTVDCILEELLVAALKAKVVDRMPFIWFWPHGASAGAVMTHDVETTAGRDFCAQLMDLDDSFGIKSSFQLVPERRYAVTPHFLESIRSRGFEINVHDLNHDGRLFSSRERFARRVERINRWGRVFDARGFRSGALYRNPEWFNLLDFTYDMSMPNVGHLEAQRGGCCTVMPFFIGDILELPLTTTQDYSLFHILNDYSIDLWERQIALITQSHGLASFIVHPDYVISAPARATYERLLAHLAGLRSDKRLWIALPGDVDRWWRDRSQMTIVGDEHGWHIEGDGAARARVAFATLIDNRLAFTIDGVESMLT